MDQKVYISKLNLRDRYRKHLPAGTKFFMQDLVKHTFDKLLKAGDIIESDPEKVFDVLQNRAPKGTRVTGPRNETPQAAINPAKQPERTVVPPDEEVKTEAQKIQEIKDKLAALGVKYSNNSKLTTLKNKLAKAVAPANEQPEAPKNVPDKVWDCDPEELEKLPFEQLLALYKETCTKYEKEVETFDTKELLVEKMSSEFNK